MGWEERNICAPGPHPLDLELMQDVRAETALDFPVGHLRS
jgi:hypothetical protein